MTADFAQLLEINRLRILSRVVSNASHDVNNALQVIGGSAEMLSTRTTLGPTEQQRVNAIARQTERITTILDRLSSLTRPSGGGRQMVDLATLADDAVALRAFALGRARIAVTIDRLEGTKCTVSGERLRLLQVFLNLLLNVEAALENRPGAAVRIAFARAQSDWVVSFIDNGPGMSDAGRAALAADAPVPAPATGLSGTGLWLSARIAEEQGGKLELDESAGQGATVNVRLRAA